MIKKEVTYKDYDEVERTEEFYFNLNEAEVVEFEADYAGGVVKLIHQIVKEEDNKKIVAIFKRLLLMSVGKKSLDGRKFVKSDEIREDLLYSGAYPVLFTELATNADAAAEFIKGILPKEKEA